MNWLCKQLKRWRRIRRAEKRCNDRLSKGMCPRCTVDVTLKIEKHPYFPDGTAWCPRCWKYMAIPKKVAETLRRHRYAELRRKAMREFDELHPRG